MFGERETGSKWNHPRSCRCEKCRPSNPADGHPLTHPYNCKCAKCEP